jgi:hypothetical protein
MLLAPFIAGPLSQQHADGGRRDRAVGEAAERDADPLVPAAMAAMNTPPQRNLQEEHHSRSARRHFS